MSRVRARREALHRAIWYMGAKGRVIPGFLERVLEDEVPGDGTVLDLMCGTGVVSAFCAARWRVVANDVQEYAAAIARSLIEHEPGEREVFLEGLDFERDLGRAYRRNRRKLVGAWGPALEEEDRLLGAFEDLPERGSRRSAWFAEYRDFIERSTALYPAVEEPRDGRWLGAWPYLTDRAVAQRRADPSVRPACLVTAYWANVYFGLRQAVEIDSVRAAVEELPADRPYRDAARAHWISALLHAASVCTSGTSHFAQPRHLRKDSELAAMARRRRLDIREHLEEYSQEIRRTVRRLGPRGGHRVMRRDYRELVRKTGGVPRFAIPERPGLVYLDPPYTADHYSRFYHVLEVLARYDYPELHRNAEGEVLRGRYPAIEQRFRSDFCRPRTVEDAFRSVIRAAAGCGAKLVVSYATPTGLLLKTCARAGHADPVARFRALCRESYRSVSVERLPMMHSGQGDSNLTIDELLLICREPKRRATR